MPYCCFFSLPQYISKGCAGDSFGVVGYTAALPLGKKTGNLTRCQLMEICNTFEKDVGVRGKPSCFLFRELLLGEGFSLFFFLFCLGFFVWFFFFRVGENKKGKEDISVSSLF